MRPDSLRGRMANVFVFRVCNYQLRGVYMEYVFTVVVQRFFMEGGCRYQASEDWPCCAIFTNEEAALEYARDLAKEYATDERYNYKITEQRKEYCYKIILKNIEGSKSWPKKVITIREQHVN